MFFILSVPLFVMLEQSYSNRQNIKYLLSAIFLILISGLGLFFLTSHCHMYCDDWAVRFTYACNGRVQNFSDIFHATWQHYLRNNGRLVVAFWEYVFVSYIDHKIVFDIANAIVWGLMAISCVILIIGKNFQIRDFAYTLSLFIVLAWFLIPVPAETMIWWVGSIDYLWSTTASMMFLCLFQHYKNQSFVWWKKLLLCLVCFYLGISNTLAVVGICAALISYYLFHIKEVKGNVAYMAIAFGVGAALTLFGPGNFVRYFNERNMVEDVSLRLFSSNMNLTFGSIITSVKSLFLRYKASWLFIIVVFWGWWKHRESLANFMRENLLFCLAWAWSAFAFCFVFNAGTRALFFTEIMAIVLIIRFVYQLVVSSNLHTKPIMVCMYVCMYGDRLCYSLPGGVLGERTNK